MGWDEGSGAGEGEEESECRKGKQRRVSQPGQHGMMIGSAGGALASPQGAPVRTRGVRQTSQSFTALAARTEWEQGGLA